MHRPLAWMLGVALLLVGVWAAAQQEVPPLRGRVTDLTGTLTAAQQQALSAQLAAFEQQKGSQIAVLLVPTTEPETIEQYGIRVVDRWKLGRQDVDDGILVLVAKQDRKIRIEVGYGLEGVVPDAIANRIIDEVMLPAFRQGEFFTGLNAGVARLMQVIEGEPLPPPRAGSGSGAAKEGSGAALMFLILFGGLFLSRLARFVGRAPAAGLLGVTVGGLAWLFTASLGLALLLALLGMGFGLMGSLGRGGGTLIYPGYRGIGGFGGGLRGGGFGGGGFGGGGGGFGGGGASGGW